MNSDDTAKSTPRFTEEDLALRLNYFSRQCWYQRHLYDRQSAALRQRIADQDAQLGDEYNRLLETEARLKDAHSRLQDVTATLSRTFAQLQDVTAAQITAELKLAGYGLLELDSSVSVRDNVSTSLLVATHPFLTVVLKVNESVRTINTGANPVPSSLPGTVSVYPSSIFDVFVHLL